VLKNLDLDAVGSRESSLAAAPCLESKVESLSATTARYIGSPKTRSRWLQGELDEDAPPYPTKSIEVPTTQSPAKSRALALQRASNTASSASTGVGRDAENSSQAVSKLEVVELD